MAQPNRNRFTNPFGREYPDDDATKPVLLQAEGLRHAMGDRHVLICWVNGTDAEGISYIQTVQLLGGPGNYNFFTPSVVRQQDAPSETFTLGTSLALNATSSSNWRGWSSTSEHRG
ncbi:hypothetical protein B0H10DRAFT_2358491 [Mycena sp. CBHHK59/15]|nr:hypothetical protein B0H10DRAFT_2358491 [Mycena sp. CBHHK59/15]